ncbi:hypothetical protein [Litchfieldia alkalitelluris]|uniref:hypothetical protein n=1 Tax=Litchfieldia alkalitelluris TaxID=304268 RepID=UPI0009960F0D|nr:hypothetical protein [Litchfieldia alkalitelluris]
MKRMYCCLICMMLLTSCGLSRYEAKPLGQGDLNEGLGDTAEDGYQSDEEILVESRMAKLNIGEKDIYSRVEAEELVRKHLNLKNDSNTVVLYNREKKDQYLIHVFEINNNKTGGIDDWYLVNPNTGKIKKDE